MINLPFEKDIAYKKHKKSYLQQAVVFLRFSEKQHAMQNELKLNEAWNAFTQSNFSLDGGNFEKENVISKADDSVDYVFSKNFVAVRVPGKNYVSFGDTLVPHVYKMKKYLKDVLNVETLSQYEIRKWDAWQIQNSNDNKNFETLIKTFFLSDEFLNYNEYVVDSIDLVENEKLLKALRWNDNGKKYEINSTMVENGAKNDLINLILYSNGVVCENISLDKLEDSLDSLNLALYKMFDWSISKNSKDLMDK